MSHLHHLYIHKYIVYRSRDNTVFFITIVIIGTIITILL